MLRTRIELVYSTEEVGESGAVMSSSRIEEDIMAARIGLVEK